MNSREAFEKLPEIAESLKDQEVYYDLNEQCYIATDVEFYYEAGYANGAHYAFQEQQKVIDEQHSMLLNQAKAMLELQEQNRILQNAADIEEQLKIELQKRIDDQTLKYARLFNEHQEGLLDLQHYKSGCVEQQKRIDAALKLITSIRAENDLWGSEQVERQIELLEQALRGGQ